MSKLSDVFVRITGDDTPFNRVAERVRRSLKGIDDTNVEPGITIPDKPIADIEALSKRLQLLNKQKINLNVSSTVAAAEVKSLASQIDTLQRQRVNVPIDLQGDINRQIADLEKALSVAERKQTRIPLTLERIDAQVEAAKAKIAELDGTAHVNVDADTAGAAAQIRRLTLREQVARIRVDVDSSSLADASRGISNLATAILALSPAALPILAATTAGIGALGVAAVGAGGAGGIFGASVAGTVAEMKAADKQMKTAGTTVQAWETKTRMAKVTLDSTKKGTAEYDAALKNYQKTAQTAAQYQEELTNQQDAFNRSFGPAAAGLTAVRNAWAAFMDATRPATVQVMGQALQVVANVLPRLAPVSNAAAVAVGRLVDRFGAFTQGPQMGTFITFLQTRGPALLTSFVNIAASVAKGLISLFSAFLPVSDQVVGGLEGMAAAFARWAKGLSASQGFSSFMDYVRQNAPAVLSFVANIFTTVVHLVEALAPFGGTMLGIINSISAGINGLPIPVVQALAAIVGTVTVALKLWQLGVFAVAAAQRIATVATLIFRGAMLAVNAVMMAGPWGWVALAIAAVVGGLILAYKHSETFRNIVNAVGSALKTGFLVALDGVKSALGWLTTAWDSAATATGGAWEKIKSAVSTGWQAVVSFLGGIIATVTAPFVAAWEAVKSATSAAFNAVVGVIKAAIGLWVAAIKIELAIVGTVFLLAWEAISAVTSTVFNFVKDKIITPVWTAVAGIFTTVTKAIATTVSGWWTTLTTNFSKAFNWIKDKIVQPVWDAVSLIFTTVMDFVKESVSNWWTLLTTVFSTSFNWIKDKIVQPVWDKISAIFTKVSGAIKTAVSTWWTDLTTKFSTAFNGIKTTLDKTWTSIKTVWTKAQTSVRTAWDTFWTKIKSVGGTAIDAVKTKIDKVFGKIKSATETFVTNVGKVFEGIKEAFAAPWRWVRDHVFGKIGSAYNKVAKLVGAKTVNLADGGDPGGGGSRVSGGGGRNSIALNADGGPISLAAGGPIRGVGGPRQDNIAGIDRRTGVQTSWVSNREYVVNAKSTEANRPLVEAINAAHGPLRAGQAAKAWTLADGGGIPRLFLGGGTAPVGGVSHRHSGYPWARWAGDFPVGTGTPVHAYKAGQVSMVRALTTSYGRHIRINHNGEETLYAHLRDFAVRVGQQVREGQTIGHSDSTGNSTGPHVHFELKGGTGKIDTGGGGGGLSSLLSFIKPRAMFTKVVNGIIGGVSRGMGALGLGLGNTPVAQMIGGLPRKVVDLLASKLPESFGDSSGSGLGARVAGAMKASRWAPTLLKAMSMTGMPLGTLDNWIRQVASESGGNPNAVQGNIGDINNRTGNLARGLLQVIPPTFQAYRSRSLPNNIFDPLANSYAAMNYAKHRYHNIEAVIGHGHGYADGGAIGQLATGGVVRGGRGGVTSRIGEGRFDELVTPLPRGWNVGSKGDTLERIASLLEERGAGDVSFNFTTYNPTEEPQSVTTNRALQRVAGLGLI